MMIQPRAPGTQETSIVLLGPNLPPQYPPRRFPAITPMRKLLTKKKLRRNSNVDRMIRLLYYQTKTGHRL